MINIRPIALRVFRTWQALPILSLLILAACPQMTTSPMGSPGSPLSAGGEGATTAEKGSDSDEVTAPPAAAAPIPNPAPPMEPAFRRIEGDTVASRDSGIFSAPTPRERIQTIGGAVRIVALPASFYDRCQDIQCVREKARSCNIHPETLAGISVGYPDIPINYDATPGSLGVEVISEGGFQGYAPADIPQIAELRGTGYFLFFVRKRENAEMLGQPSDIWNPVPTCSELASYLDDPRADFVGDRLISFVYTPLPLSPGFLLRFQEAQP